MGAFFWNLQSHKRALLKARVHSLVDFKQNLPSFTTPPHSFPLLASEDIHSKMPERPQAASGSTNNRATTGVRRNLFHQHLSRRPTSHSSTSTSAETLRLDNEHESETSDIVIRNKDGEFEIGDPQMQALDEQEEEEQVAQEHESMFMSMGKDLDLLMSCRGDAEIVGCC